VAKEFAEMIRGGGYEVDVFTDPMLASEKIGSQHSIYLLVLTGWRMPRLSGPALALDLSKIDPGIKIILFSALDSQTANKSLDFMARTCNVKFDHFSIPVMGSELLEMINNKIKYGNFDESDIIRRHRFQKQSPYSMFRRYFRQLWYQLRHHKRDCEDSSEKLTYDALGP
jgi:DNA-binding NtrC family response regulator